MELGEEAEFTLRVALARIYQLYTVLDLARLDLYDPVKQLLDAQVSGLFPLQYEKVCLPAGPRARAILDWTRGDPRVVCAMCACRSWCTLWGCWASTCCGARRRSSPRPATPPLSRTSATSSSNS